MQTVSTTRMARRSGLRTRTAHIAAACLAFIFFLGGLGACAAPEPPSVEPSQVAKLDFGSDYRGVEESPVTFLEGEYSLDADCAGGTDAVIAILVDGEEVRRVPIECRGASSTPVVFEESVPKGVVTLELVSGTGEGSAALITSPR